MTTNFTAIRPSASANSVSGCSATSARLALMPTAMKKSPSSRPLNGSMSASSSWRNSESASSTPARNAPSDIDSPIFSMISAEPTTSSSAAAVKTSRLLCARDQFQRGPHEQAARADHDRDHGDAFRRGEPVRAAMRGCRGQQRQQRQHRYHREVLEQQHRERVAAVRRRELSALGKRGEHQRGRRHARAPSPMTSAASHASPNAWRRARAAAPVTPTCAPPRPKTVRRSAHSRAGRARARSGTAAAPRRTRRTAASTRRRRTTPSPHGPISMPAAR